MKLGIVGDIHLDTRPPGRRTETYLADIQAKLDEVATHSQEVDAWVLIGDVFHSKRANRVPPSLVLWTWDWLYTLAGVAGRRIFIVPGNHDLADGSIESLARQPLAILGRHPAVTLALGTAAPGGPEAEALSHGRLFMAVPGTGPVCDATVPADQLFTFDAVEWVAAHAPVDTQRRPWATYDANELPLGTNTKGIIYGHQHDRARAFRRPDGKLVIATGAIARGSVAEADHAPAWVVLDTETEDVDIRPITCARPSGEVFRWAERASEGARDEAMAAFTDALGASTLEGFSREGLIDGIRQRSDLPEPVRAKAVEILETTG